MQLSTKLFLKMIIINLHLWKETVWIIHSHINNRLKDRHWTSLKELRLKKKRPNGNLNFIFNYS